MRHKYTRLSVCLDNQRERQQQKNVHRKKIKKIAISEHTNTHRLCGDRLERNYVKKNDNIKKMPAQHSFFYHVAGRIIIINEKVEFRASHGKKMHRTIFFLFIIFLCKKIKI